MGMLRIMSRGGDDRVVWDAAYATTDDPEAMAAVQEAERIFYEQRARGATAFSVEKGRPPVRIDQFDPAADQIVLLPRLMGG